MAHLVLHRMNSQLEYFTTILLWSPLTSQQPCSLHSRAIDLSTMLGPTGSSILALSWWLGCPGLTVVLFFQLFLPLRTEPPVGSSTVLPPHDCADCCSLFHFLWSCLLSCRLCVLLVCPPSLFSCWRRDTHSGPILPWCWRRSSCPECPFAADEMRNHK